MLRPMLRPLVVPVLRRIGTPSWAAAFSPKGLFAAGEQGAWYDPTDLSTLFQDAGGTIPVTAAGQTVALTRDKSGRNNHATWTNAVYQVDGSGRPHIVLNGTNAGGSTGAVNFTATDKVTAWAGLAKLSDAATGILVELTGSTPANNGAFYLAAPASTGADKFKFASKGTVEAGASTTSATYNAPFTAVLTGIGDIGGKVSALRVNGVELARVTTDQGTGNYSSALLYIGRRGGGSLPVSGRLYGLIVRGATTSAAQLAQTERWMGGKMGIVL